MTRIVTPLASDLARAVMREDAPQGPVIDRLARAAYEGHGVCLAGRPWDELGDAQQERWRWAVRSMLLAANERTK